jgi:large subunit ribosomal protein L2
VFWQPRTPGTRHRISIDYKALGIYTGAPVPHLSHRKANTAGRNAHGHITVRHRGGGVAKVLRDVDMRQRPQLGQGVVERIELDPNRTGFLSLVRYEGKQLRFRLDLPFSMAINLQPTLKAGRVYHQQCTSPVRPQCDVYSCTLVEINCCL